MGFCNFYRRFIRRYSHIARPITQLLRGSKNGRKTGDLAKEWGAKQTAAFHKLLDAFTQAPLLRHFDPERPSKIETDASDRALGAIYSQKFENGLWHPVAFHSRAFKGAEERYGTPDKEMYAIVEAFRRWRHYLEGSKHAIEVWTDHHNLQSFMKQPRLNGRQARWCYELCPFDFVIRYKPGAANPADAPSRRPDYGAAKTEDDTRGLLATLEAKFARVQQISRALKETARAQRAGERQAGTAEERTAGEQRAGERQAGTAKKQKGSSGNEMTESLRRELGVKVPCTERRGPPCQAHSPGETEEADHLLRVVRMQAITRRVAKRATHGEKSRGEKPVASLLELIVAAQESDPLAQRLKGEVERGEKAREHYRVQKGALLFKDRLYVPSQRSLIGELMQVYHDDEHAGHWGSEKTLELLKRKYHWKGMAEDVEDYVRTCPVCQGKSVANHKPYGKLQSLPRPARPWKEISIDWITGLPESDGYDAILTIVDRFTKMAVFVPCQSTMDAAEMAEVLYREVFLRFGTPTGVVSDRDSRITSRYWAEVCYYAVIKRRLSTAFHPQTDGQTEALNKAVENYLRAFTSTEQVSWPKLLPTAAFAYNNSYNHTTRMTPFRCMYGYDPDIRIDVADDVPEGRIPSAKQRVEQLHELQETLKRRWSDAQEHQAKYYNQRHLPMEFKRGQKVKLSTRHLKLKDKKLAPRWIGPLKITRVVGSQAYELALPEQYRRLHPVFPIQLLEKWNSRDDEEDLPLPELEDEQDEYEVEEVKGKQQLKDGEIRYLVKWTGWPAEYNQWVPEEDINCPSLIQRFEKSRKRTGNGSPRRRDRTGPARRARKDDGMV